MTNTYRGRTVETRCRFTPDGITTCPEVTLRLDAIDRAHDLGLETDGLGRQIDLHLKSLDLRDRDDAR